MTRLFVVALLFAAPQTEEAKCTPVSGTFTNVFLVGPEACPTSPIFLCTQGELSGDLTGTYAFTFSTSESTSEGGEVSSFTGTSLITTAGATLTGDDFGSLRTTAFPLADFTTHLSFTSGATGQLTIQGTASFATGLGSGTYRGVLCAER
jgi:hypothetical protein